MHRFVAAVCLAIAPVIAVATIYKVQMPDGTILFTDAPPAEGKVLEERATKSTPRPAAKAAAPAGAGPATGSSAPPPVRVLPTPAPATGQAREVPRNLDAAIAELTAAERELAVARRKLEVGREPQPGERLGTAKGGSRLSPEYKSRVGHLER